MVAQPSQVLNGCVRVAEQAHAVGALLVMDA